MLYNKILFKSNLRYFFSILFDVYVVILFFDPMRESLDFGKLNSMVSVLRDLIIYLLFFIIFVCTKKKKISIFFDLFSISFFIMIILSFFSEIEFSKNIKVIYATYRGFLVCYVIKNLFELYVYSLEELIKKVIGFVLIDFIVTIVIYFIFPELISKRTFNFRISIGNPSMQSILFICGFILCFYVRPYKNKFLNDFTAFILLFATFSTITSTATLAVFVVITLTIFNEAFTKRWLSIIIILLLLFLLFILILKIDITPFTKYFHAKFDEIIIVVCKKFGIETTVTTGYHSYGLRERQIETFYQNFSGLNKYFGDGIFCMVNPGKYLIENTYYSIVRDFGFFGLAIFCCFYLNGIYKAFSIYIHTKKYSSFIILCVSLVYCATLYIIAANSLLVQLYFFYQLCQRFDKTEKINS